MLVNSGGYHRIGENQHDLKKTCQTKTQMHTQNLFRLVTPKIVLVSVIRDVFVIFGSRNLGDETKVTHGRSWQASIEPQKKNLLLSIVLVVCCLIGVLIMAY